MAAGLAAGLFMRFNSKFSKIDLDAPQDESELAVPNPVPATSEEIRGQAADTSALGGYNVLIADRGNNRIIEVTPDKKIVWEYHFNLPRMGLGADDAFFTDNGKSVIVNLEEYHLIQIIDYATKKVAWSYGVGGIPGSADGMLNTPDDSYKLANGDVTVADIKNCRVIEIAADKHIVHQYGFTKKCGSVTGYLNKPNGDTPLPGGGMYISNIVGHSLLQLDKDWNPVFKMNLPVVYPSDPQPTKAGNILVADYSTPGQIVEVAKNGDVVWRFNGDGSVKMNKPSLAIELPNGNVLTNDDLNHRVIVVNKADKKIVWQYGVTGKPGNTAGQLNIPDGVDIIPTDHIAGGQTGAQNAPSQAQSSLPTLTVGAVSRHASTYLNQEVKIQGYVLSKQQGYVIFSDEPTGAIGYYDLPVAGLGVGDMLSGTKYLLDGTLVPSTLGAINKNPYELQLLSLPQPAP